MVLSVFFKSFAEEEELLFLDARVISPQTLAYLQAPAFAGERYDRLTLSLEFGSAVDEPVSVAGLGLVAVMDAFSALPQQLASGHTIATPYPADLIMTARDYLLLQVMPVGSQHPTGNVTPALFFATRFELCYGTSLALAAGLYPPLS